MVHRRTVEGDRAVDLVLRLEAAAKGQRGASGRLLREAARTITDLNRHDPQFHIAALRQVCVSGPSIWVGEDKDGDEVLILFRNGVLKAYLDDSLIEHLALKQPDSDTLTTAVMVSSLSDLFEFPINARQHLRPV